MKKRLRKKFRIGEFKELGFTFAFSYKGDMESPACEAFLQEFIEQCIDANGLDCDGNLTEEGCFFMAVANDPRDTTLAQRDAVKAWIDARPDAEVISMGELMDLWYELA